MIGRDQLAQGCSAWSIRPPNAERGVILPWGAGVPRASSGVKGRSPDQVVLAEIVAACGGL